MAPRAGRAPQRRDTMSSPCGAAILAGGRASRLNAADKRRLRVGGRTILERQLEILHRLAPTVLMVGGDPVPAAGVEPVADERPGCGPLGGIYTALRHTDAPCVVIVACDMPFLSLAFLEHLVERVSGLDVALPRTDDGYHPLCAAYARTALPAVRNRLARGELAVRGMLGDLRVAEIGPEELGRFDPERVMLFNVNTPQDYDRACAWAARA